VQEFIKPINIVFYSSNAIQARMNKEREDAVITKLQSYISGQKIDGYDIHNNKTNRLNNKYKTPSEVLNIFVNSYI
jgi:hypothetical protein